ncbi:L-aspartate oxidase [Desulfofundulus kuznetsovii DSM 6115]|uniref:L-aspartate oxidase n=1 Tax=Desulfofundulus kuznetsovii (strain DSM 6115 / VKM B-1805 / 17) TaxID=760568 RepID=A0AAU8P943_DESK7|nr:L-aspartate oxidase [Desulfofundulus kuznetsovii DSM 6115]
MDVVSTDVLIIGSGIAGLYAAITARKKGREVLLCSKVTPGLASSSALSQGSFRSEVSGFTPEQHRQLTLKAGYNLNEPLLVETLVENAARAVLSLKEFGVEIKERGKGFFVPAEKIGQEGLNITKPMAECARRLGVKFFYPFLAFDLLQKEGQAVGVWGLLKKEGKPLAIAARAVVLATGGGGAAFLRTDNPPGNIGDGYALAYRAGLPLIDLEFVQFYPLATAMPGQSNRFVLAILADAGKLLNGEGENLLEKYQINESPVAVVCRDLLSRAMCTEVAKGQGIAGAIKLDLSNSEEGWRRAQKLWGYGDEQMDGIKSWASRLFGKEEYVLVMPTTHFFMGGVVVDPWGRTGIPGLFAVGEVTGGLHGANRLGGNALTEVVVFGQRAGLAASEFAAGQKGTSLSGKEVSLLALRFWDYIREKLSGRRGEGVSLVKIKKAIRRTLWENAGVLRSEESLKKALVDIKRLEEEIQSGKPGELVDLLEVLNLLLVSRMVVESALYRRESRGAHYRLDFPQQDDVNWFKHTLVRRRGEQMDVLACPVGFL